jgi:hypothetical protein
MESLDQELLMMAMLSLLIAEQLLKAGMAMQRFQSVWDQLILRIKS